MLRGEAHTKHIPVASFCCYGVMTIDDTGVQPQCVLPPSLSPIGEDVPDDAVVALADEGVEGALLPCVATARAPASRARGKSRTLPRDEGAEPQDLFVSQSAMGLPAAMPRARLRLVF